MHHEKQGLLYCLQTFNGLKQDKIGNETLLRNIVKLTAPCWTRCIYRYPPLANQIWNQWRSELPESRQLITPAKLPKGWQKRPYIANNVIKSCPFCMNEENNLGKKNGNLEYLHLYCNSPIL